MKAATMLNEVTMSIKLPIFHLNGLQCVVNNLLMRHLSLVMILVLIGTRDWIEETLFVTKNSNLLPLLKLTLKRKPKLPTFSLSFLLLDL
jgi:hypothetical protein